MVLRAPSFEQICWVVIIIGVLLRAGLWAYNPPENTYDGDHHKKVIKIYNEEKARPAPDRCWQCYHPPFFYSISACIYELSSHLPLLKTDPWKATQGLNLLASAMTLILLFYLLRLLGVCPLFRLMIVSLAVILPRDIYSSAMMSNDYLLVFFTIASAYVFVRSINQLKANGSLALKSFLWLGLITILGSLTKQHGLLLLVFPLYTTYLIMWNGPKRQIPYITSALVLVIGLSGSSEIWLYSQTGQFLVSNQDFFDFAAGQKPGSLSEVEFTTLNLSSLFHNPLISKGTNSSLPTQLFARLWFDHEYKFMVPDTAFVLTSGRLAYSFGLMWTTAAILIGGYYAFYQARYRLLSVVQFRPSVIACLFFVSLLFLLVPVVQTIRLPYFTSMKAIFYLPAMPIVLALLGYCCQRVFPNPNRRFVVGIALLNLLIGILIMTPVVFYLG